MIEIITIVKVLEINMTIITTIDLGAANETIIRRKTK